MRIIKTIKKFNKEIILCALAFFFATWLMFSSFSYQNGSILISTKSWSDFASHLPLIGSFSLGNNFPPEYPLFFGSPIKYHFLFYFFVGILEKIGLRIDLALNFLSIIGFSTLILIIFKFSQNLFKSLAVGLLSVLFFLFNSSLDFLYFFKTHGLNFYSISDIIKNTSFPSFGPYDGAIISAFWSLNIYTNQRHLAISYALSLFLIYILINFKTDKKRALIIKSFLLGLTLGFSFLLNMAVFAMSIVVVTFLFIFFPKQRLSNAILLITALIIALPQYLFIQGSISTFNPSIKIGYLVENLNILNFINYWWQNIGLNLILIPAGFLIANNYQRKIFISFLSLFILGNFIQFTPEIAANHKFFNYFIVIGAMFSAFFIVKLWKKNLYLKILSVVLIFLMIFSGIIHLFPILNDNKIPIPDYPINKDIRWIINNTSSNARFLNSEYLYTNASLAGRKIFLGWPYFAWSQGYDTNTRDALRKKLLNTNNLNYFCDNVLKYNIDYAEIIKSENMYVNNSFLDKHFIRVYYNNDYAIYSLTKCQ